MSAPHQHRLLVVDDEPDLRTLYELTLLREGYHIDTAGCVDDALLLLQEHAYSLVITDMRLPDGTGLDLIRKLEADRRSERSIVITAYGSAENAVSALKAGAYDYLTKPVDLKQFRQVVASALAQPQLPASAPAAISHTLRPPTEATPQPTQLSASGQASSALARLVGTSQAMQQVRILIDKVARSMAPVLIWGESGTGKELAARAIHDVSSRASKPFIAVNCGAIPEQLLEAEFFGYRKGSFTGANEDRDGFFQAAHGGTLFLDEIGDLPLPMQSKLLRAIQERAVRAVGATNEIHVDVRVVSATHKDLQSEVQAGRFRQDLYYRLNVIQITLPSLRDRKEDLPQLCQRILDRISHDAGMDVPATLSANALNALTHHAFDGNVRELENLLHRAVALSNHNTLEAEDLGLPMHPAAAVAAESTSDIPAAVTTADVTPAHTEPEAAPLPSDLASHLDRIERDILIRALEKHRLNRTAAGASLGLSLRQMRYRMARLGVNVGPEGVTIGERFDPDHDCE